MLHLVRAKVEGEKGKGEQQPRSSVARAPDPGAEGGQDLAGERPEEMHKGKKTITASVLLCGTALHLRQFGHAATVGHFLSYVSSHVHFKNPYFLTLDSRIPAEGCFEHEKNRQKPSVFNVFWRFSLIFDFLRKRPYVSKTNR